MGGPSLLAEKHQGRWLERMAGFPAGGIAYSGQSRSIIPSPQTRVNAPARRRLCAFVRRLHTANSTLQVTASGLNYFHEANASSMRQESAPFPRMPAQRQAGQSMSYRALISAILLLPVSSSVGESS